jgi:hypothetical protein
MWVLRFEHTRILAFMNDGEGFAADFIIREKRKEKKMYSKNYRKTPIKKDYREPACPKLLNN